MTNFIFYRDLNDKNVKRVHVMHDLDEIKDLISGNIKTRDIRLLHYGICARSNRDIFNVEDKKGNHIGYVELLK